MESPGYVRCSLWTQEAWTLFSYRNWTLGTDHKLCAIKCCVLPVNWWSELIILFLGGKISKPLKLLFKGNLWLPNSKLVTTWYPRSWGLTCHLTASPEITLMGISALWCRWLSSHGGSWDGRPAKEHCLRAVQIFTLHLTTKKPISLSQLLNWSSRTFSVFIDLRQVTVDNSPQGLQLLIN